MKANLRPYAAALALSVLAAPGAAQSVNGLQIVEQLANGALRREFGNANLFQDAVRFAWLHAKPAADREVEAAIAANNRNLPHGVTLYHQHSALSANPIVETTALDGGRTIHLHLTLPHNSVVFHSTTPTVFGKFADPKMALDYDLVIDAIVPVPDLTRPLAVQRVTAEVRNAKLSAHNVAASVAQAGSDTVRFFGGPDFKARIERRIDQQQDFTGTVNAALAPINQRLQKLAGDGFTSLLSRVDPVARQLILQAVHPR